MSRARSIRMTGHRLPNRTFSLPSCSNRLWRQPVYPVDFEVASNVESGRSVMLTTNLHSPTHIQNGVMLWHWDKFYLLTWIYFSWGMILQNAKIHYVGGKCVLMFVQWALSVVHILVPLRWSCINQSIQIFFDGDNFLCPLRKSYSQTRCQVQFCSLLTPYRSDNFSGV
jgi:hypothetical protein